MTNPLRPVLLAVALAVVISFTIGGPLHTIDEYPGDGASVPDAAFAQGALLEGELTGDKLFEDKPSGVASAAGSAASSAGGVIGTAQGGPAPSPPATEPAGSAVVALAQGASGAGLPEAQDAVGGPSEFEATALVGPARPTITYYTVRRGETLSDIAKKFDISPMTIMAANDLVNANAIQAGQQLRILSTDGAIHEVKSGESLWEIARRYRAGIDEIVTANGITNPNRIMPAQELVIPGVQAAEIGSMLRSERLVSADGRLLPMFDWPVRGRISSNFGMRWGRMHYGMDIAVNTGTPVRAAARGRVTFAGMNGGYGNLVIIDHGDGVETRYAHNSRIVVKVGDYVNRGQLVAYSGNTGNSTGPHLHFEIRYKGNAVDPRNYLR